LAFYYTSLNLRNKCAGRVFPQEKGFEHLYPSMGSISAYVFPKRKVEPLTAPRAPVHVLPSVSAAELIARAANVVEVPVIIVKSHRPDIQKSLVPQSIYVSKQDKKSRAALLPVSIPVSVDASTLFTPLRQHVHRAIRACAAKGARHDLCVSMNSSDGLLDAIIRAAGGDRIPVQSNDIARRVRVRVFAYFSPDFHLENSQTFFQVTFLASTTGTNPGRAPHRFRRDYQDVEPD
jgi:hypothetical protein